jgi:hypothetical protein
VALQEAASLVGALHLEATAAAAELLVRAEVVEQCPDVQQFRVEAEAAVAALQAAPPVDRREWWYTRSLVRSRISSVASRASLVSGTVTSAAVCPLLVIDVSLCPYVERGETPAHPPRRRGPGMAAAAVADVMHVGFLRLSPVIPASRCRPGSRPAMRATYPTVADQARRRRAARLGDQSADQPGR